MLELFTGPTQDTRLLRFYTPLGPDKLLAECLRAEEGLGQCFEYQLTALSTDARISLASLLGQPVLLELLTANSRDTLRPFHGHVTAAEQLGADGGVARYQLTIGPWYAFLGHGRDSRVFQGMTVFDILDAVFGGWTGAGRLAPAWRFDIADRSIYPARSLTCQYQESSLAFAERLMQEEGLFYYFEHCGERASASLGRHTMVIADHNGAFLPNVQAEIEFTQPGAVMKRDSMDRWRSNYRQRTNSVAMASWDYRTLGRRALSTDSNSAGTTRLTSTDAPGAYAYETRAQGERSATCQIQAHDAAREIHTGAGTVRTLAPGTTFTLHGQARLDADGEAEARSFAIVRVIHLAHNNLSAQVRDAVTAALGQSALERALGTEGCASVHATGLGHGERPLYRNRIDAIRSSTPYRSSSVDADGNLLCPRPTVHGQQSAIVVGPEGSSIHTDRDHRIKVQFHWQRGTMSHSRLAHPMAAGHSGAPASDQAGTWVRLATPMAPIAGANWGSVAVPRVGSEVLVDFIDGDIDRPVVIASLYNGAGAVDSQSNQVAQGAGAATGNAPAWFPGDAGAHAHPAVLSGFKTQAMAASQSGNGAYSQLVFDDTAGQARLALQRHASSHQGTAELNLGALRHQSDNRQLQMAGFGAELKSEHGAALRSGAGMLVSSHARANAAGAQLDSREAQAQMEQSLELALSMVTSARKHNALLQDEADLPAKLPALAAASGSIEAVKATASGAAAGAAGTAGADGGQGEVTAYDAPHLQLSSPAGIASVSPADAVLAAGDTSTLCAGQDINFASQGNFYHAVQGGISLFTYGTAARKEKPNQEAGLMLHAATGKVSSQSQGGETRITADKTVTVASVSGHVAIAGQKHVMLTAQGAFLKIEGGNIMLHGPGKMEFKAGMKELSGPVSVPSVAIAGKIHELKLQRDLTLEYVDADGNPLSGEPIAMKFHDDSKQVILDASGKTVIKNAKLGPFTARQPRRNN